jgi:DNA-binding NtrC family response regulator
VDDTIIDRNRVQVHGGTLSLVGAAENRPGRLLISTQPKLVGRDANADLVLADPRVSLAHLEVQGTPHGVSLRDLESTNGTFIGSIAIDRVLVQESVVVRCGDTLLRFDPAATESVKLPSVDAFGELVGTTPVMRALFLQLQKIAPSHLSVVLHGETGTGKEVAARSIHAASPRASGPFLAINCGSIPEPLLEADLFGYERGAFTSADKAHTGMLESANGGTFLFDEIGEMSEPMQVKLLRVLEERLVRPLGSSRSRKLDVRILTATHRDLTQEVNAGRFRSDLYFRISQARIELPPLRKRLGDIRPLVDRLMTQAGCAAAYRRVPEASFARLEVHPWRGNVRELKNVVEGALAYDEGGVIDLAAHLAQSPANPRSGARMSIEESRDIHDRDYYIAALADAKGNLSELARIAQSDRKTVRTRLKELGLRLKDDAS